MSAYATTLKSFCEELLMTFPELATHISRAATVSPAQYWKSWIGSLDILLTKSTDGLMKDRKGFLIGAVRLTPAVWSEISEKTQAAIWKYLRTLTLESVMETGIDSLGAEVTQKLMNIMTAERLESDPEAASSEMFEESMKHMKPLMEKLKGLLGENFMDVSGFTMPEIPERLRKGRIAKMAEDMAKQFDPADFGIDPALLTGDNVEEILKRLAELYQRDPTLLISGAKRVADRIKKQIQGGSLNRDDLVAEAKEFIEIFKEHPMFKEMMGKVAGMGGLAEMFGAATSPTSEAAPSERLLAARERLRRKMAERKK